MLDNYWSNGISQLNRSTFTDGHLSYCITQLTNHSSQVCRKVKNSQLTAVVFHDKHSFPEIPSCPLNKATILRRRNPALKIKRPNWYQWRQIPWRVE